MLNLYETFYKLSADPFRLNPDHQFSFGHRSYAKAKAYLEYALQRGEGFIVITGGPGTGKTTLINGILAGLNTARVRVATLTSTRLVPLDLLHMVAASFGLHFEDTTKATLLLGLEEYLTQQSRQGWRAILIVDEAQDLSPNAVEELRLLANLQHNNRLLLQVFLVGHEELRDLIRAPGMEHLRQRIIAASHLEPLDLDETVTYIEHRLCRAGWQGDPAINADALRLIYQFSGGIPRRINLICSRLLLYGGMEGKHKLVAEDAWSVIEDLRQELLMVPEDSTEAEVYQDIAAQANSKVRALAHGLPRAQSFARAGQPSSCRSLEGAEKPVTDGRRRVRTAAGRSARSASLVRENYPRIEPVLGEEALDDARAPAAHPLQDKSPPMQLEIDAGHRAGWRWWAVAVVVLAVGLSLATNMETEIRDRLMNFIRPVAIETDSSARTVVAEAEREGAIQDDLSDTEAPRARSALVDAGTSSEFTTATDAALPAGPQSAVEASEESPRVALASELSRPPVEEETGNAEVATAEPEDRQTAEPLISSTDAVIEAEHSRLRDEADQHFSQQLTAIELAREPVASPQFEPTDPFTDASARPATEPATPAAPRSPGRVEDADIEATPGVPGEVVDRSGDSTTAAAIMPASPTVSEPRRVSSPPVSRIPAVVPADERKPYRAEPADRPTDNTRVATITAAPTASVETGRVSSPPASRVVSAVRAREPEADRSEPAAKFLSAPVTPPTIKSTPVPTVLATAPRYGVGASVGSRDQLRSALLGGQWNSRGKPAVLLPSEITYCKAAGERINCWSVPQDINTKFGPALYKVEGTLQDFSAQGDFRLSYRTLVRLVSSEAAGGTNAGVASSAEGHWQITEHAMNCELTQPDNIRCRDEKGITRNYRR